jgi:hypothetical protein
MREGEIGYVENGEVMGMKIATIARPAFFDGDTSNQVSSPAGGGGQGGGLSHGGRDWAGEAGADKRAQSTV